MEDTKKFMVIHYSNNWTMGPWSVRYNTLAEARQYLRNFQGTYSWHKDDSYQIVELKEEGNATKIDTKLAGFKID